MSAFRKLLSGQFICALALLSATTGVHSTPLLSLTPNPSNTINNGIGYSLGYEFTLSQAVSVDALGWYAGRALSQSHSVGIFSTGGILLDSTTVTTSDPIINGFAYDTVPTFALAAGTYVIAGVTGTADPYTFNPTTITYDPRVTFDGALYSASSTLIFPTNSDAAHVGYFGPNIDFVTSVPEPITFSIFGAGLIGAIGLRRRGRTNG